MKFAGADGAVTGGAVTFSSWVFVSSWVFAFVVEDAEPPAFVAVNWKLYDVPAAKPVIVALVADVAGAVAVVHVVVPATLYCNV